MHYRKRKARIRIPKGTMIKSMGPKRTYPAGRTYTVVATYTEFSEDKENHQVRWAGAGMYWCYVKATDIEVLEWLD